MKKIITLIALISIAKINMAQKLIPFQYQSQKQWDNSAKWGYMTEDRKIILTPKFAAYTPEVIVGEYVIFGNKIMETQTGKIVWDSTETEDIAEIKGNIVSIKEPLRGAVNYQPYSFKNIKTKKKITEEGKFSNLLNFIISYNAGSYGVVDENGKNIIPIIKYQNIANDKDDFFVANNDYDGYCYVYNKKGEKLNSVSYTAVLTQKSKNNNSNKQLRLAQREIKGTSIVYEIIFLNPSGKEMGKHIYTKTKNIKNLFELTSFGYAISDTSTVFFNDPSCSVASKLKKNIIVNNEGNIIINSDEYSSISELGNELFYAVGNEKNKSVLINNKGNIVLNTDAYNEMENLNGLLITAPIKGVYMQKIFNNKGEIVADLYKKWDDQIFSNAVNSFILMNGKKNELTFFNYDAKAGLSKSAEILQMGDSVKIDEVKNAFNKYYILKVADYIKKQYSSYIYDNNGKLVLKSEDGLWMFKDDFLIKYIPNSKGDKFYLGYYDASLKPYSIIKE